MPQSLMRNVIAALPKPSLSARAFIWTRASALQARNTRRNSSTMPSSPNGSFRSPETGRITGTNRQSERRAKVEIALVMRGNSHDRASPVIHQNEVPDPHRYLRAAVRIDREPRVGAPSFTTSPGPLFARASIISFARTRPASSNSFSPADAPAPGSRRSPRKWCRPAW